MKNSENIIALIDCNNFYVSCERVFNPKLIRKPVIVMSNNDGCVVSRSNEVKAMGILLGTPVFKCRNLIKKHRIRLLSSNYALYGDMSQRVMDTLRQFTPELEVNSIDEAFLSFTGMQGVNLTEYGCRIRVTVKQWTGLPVSVGIARTKTLAKIANLFAKKVLRLKGVLNMLEVKDMNRVLAAVDVGDVWGIGWKRAKFLYKHNIKTALDLANMDDTWVKKNLTMDGLRILMELRGKPCMDLVEQRATRKSILTSRSFSKAVYERKELRESVATYATRAAEKLRRENCAAAYVSVFVAANKFREKYYSNNILVTLKEPSNHTSDIIKAALKGIDVIYRDSCFYKKTGVLLTGLVPENLIQQDLFDPDPNPEKKAALTKAIDLLNTRYGRETVKYASIGLKKDWIMKRKFCSNRSTTVWSEIPVVKS